MIEAPFITIFATKRRSDPPDLPGSYSDKRHVWVVNGTEEDIPLIRAKPSINELLTKTKIEREEDDVPINNISASQEYVWTRQLFTKTEVQREQDE